MKKVVATGVFEILHPGHVLFLEESKKMGDKLIVIVARDSNVRKRKPIVPESQRLEVVRSLKVVDEAILGDRNDILKSIEKIKPDVITLGKNQDFDEGELQRGLEDRNLKAKVVRIQKFWKGPLSGSKEIIDRIRGL